MEKRNVAFGIEARVEGDIAEAGDRDCVVGGAEGGAEDPEAEMTFEEWFSEITAFPSPLTMKDLEEHMRWAWEAGYREAVRDILERQMAARPEREEAEAKRLKNLKSLPGA